MRTVLFSNVEVVYSLSFVAVAVSINRLFAAAPTVRLPGLKKSYHVQVVVSLWGNQNKHITGQKPYVSLLHTFMALLCIRGVYLQFVNVPIQGGTQTDKSHGMYTCKRLCRQFLQGCCTFSRRRAINCPKVPAEMNMQTCDGGKKSSKMKLAKTIKELMMPGKMATDTSPLYCASHRPCSL